MTDATPRADGRRLSVGIDLGATKCLVAWVDEAGTIAHQVRIPSPHDVDGFVTSVGDILRGDLPATVGIGVPGFVDRACRRVIRCPNLPGYVDVPLADLIEQAVGVPVRLENDANAAALGESRFGAGEGLRDQVFVILGSGVGGGIIANGALIRGVGYAGEIGHLTIDPDGPLCGCGRRGCWELYASGRALAALANVATGEEVRDGLFRDEPWAVRAFDAYLDRVSEGLADLSLALAPEAIVLGGGVSEIGARLADGVAAQLRRRLPDFIEAPSVRTARLGNLAGAIGAAQLFG